MTSFCLWGCHMEKESYLLDTSPWIELRESYELETTFSSRGRKIFLVEKLVLFYNNRKVIVEQN